MAGFGLSVANGLLTLNSFDYSIHHLTDIMKKIGIPDVAVNRITIQIELEYHKFHSFSELIHRNSKENYLLTALSYTFDYLMRSFIEEDCEFATVLAQYTPKQEEMSCPLFSEAFKDFVDLLSQERYQTFYDEIKRFTIENWIAIYNHVGNGHGKTLSELLRNFCNTMETKILVEFGKDVTCELEDGDVKEGFEQLILNMIGGGILNQMITDISKKEMILNKHMRILQFLKPEHLEVKEGKN